MKCFMVTVTLPDVFSRELLALIPSQRAYINKLMGRGIVSTYTLSQDRTSLWIIMFGETQSEVQEYVDKFPMRDFMEVDIEEAMFHHNAAHYVFPMSMN